MTAPLIDFANRLNVTRQAQRLANWSRHYDSGAIRWGRNIDPVQKANWLKTAHIHFSRIWFLQDNFPVGRMFEYLGVKCQSLGVDSRYGEEIVNYLAKGENNGIVERRLSFDCAFELICGEV